jgi:nucleotide-binding universal stress UspA family protein
MNKILVAIDGSKHSQKVTDEAVTVAESMGASIILLYVCPDVAVPPEFEEFARIEHMDFSEYYSRVGEGILSKFAPKVKEEGIEVETVSEVGRASDEIVDVAKTAGASLIVLGMHGQHSVGHLRTLGSTARRVIEQSPVPVVVVP